KEAEKAQREADERAKQERIAREKAENERLAREKAEQAEKLAAERAAKLNSTYTSVKFLGRSFTAEQSRAIRAGTFDDMELGDYWRINGVTWRIVDFDYLIRSGKVDKSKHHVMIVPDSSLYRARMNSTNSISTIRGVGYIASEMYRSGLNRARQIIEEAFGKGHILPDYGVELMTQAMFFGKKDMVFSLFWLNTDFKSTNKSGEYYWLQDASSYSRFSVVGDYSNWTSHSDLPAAYDSGGVRPAFAIY
ncbi:MAG: cell envelope integrity protein TolA, partial [Synergistaceae bacterium]|nr:cell envelope integrity protein TolA [Synergistaceae bacterium]